MEKIIVAFENERTAQRVKELLEACGAASCLVCRTADQVRRTIHKLRIPAVVCGWKLGDQTAEMLFDDLPASCAMLVLAPKNRLELMGNDDIFRLCAPAPEGTWRPRCGCCCRSAAGWSGMGGPAAAGRSGSSSTRPRPC